MFGTTTEPESHYERQLRFANEAYAKLTRQRDELLSVVGALVADPHGCPMCHSGKLINPNKGHWDECPFLRAEQIMNSKD
jgi:hypothetical protein